MNGSIVEQSAQSFGDRILKQFDDDDVRQQQIYLSAFGRQSTNAESRRDLNYIRNLISDSVDEKEAWRLFCHTLLMSNEFMFVR